MVFEVGVCIVCRGGPASSFPHISSPWERGRLGKTKQYRPDLNNRISVTHASPYIFLHTDSTSLLFTYEFFDVTFLRDLT